MKVEEIKAKLLTDDKWLERGVYAIWKNQTQSEKVQENTHLFNGIGFNGVDGHIMTSFGNWLDKRTYGGRKLELMGQILSPKQKAIARKKMAKYAGQLARIAVAK